MKTGIFLIISSFLSSKFYFYDVNRAEIKPTYYPTLEAIIIRSIFLKILFLTNIVSFSLFFFVTAEFSNLQVKEMSAVGDILSSWRTEHTLSGFEFLPDLKLKDIFDLTPDDKWSSGGNSNGADIMLSFHERDRMMAQYLVDRLHYYLPQARISLPEETKVRHSLLDDAAIVVPLLSCSFTATAELTEELNTALCRQRFSNKLVLFPIALEPLPITPSYFHLIWSLISCEDKVWKNYNTITKNSTDKLVTTAEQKCLDYAARMVSLILLNPGLFNGSFKTLLSIQELRDTTLRFRAKMPVNSIGYNPLYFEESRAGHSPSEVNDTVKKDLCHSVSGPCGTEETASDRKVGSIAPIQEASVNVVPVYGEKPAPPSTELSVPIEERRKVPKEPSENAEETLQDPTDDSSCTGSLNLVTKDDKNPLSQHTAEKIEANRENPSNSGVEGKSHKDLAKYRFMGSVACCVS